MTATRPIHFMTGSSTVRCGERMGHWKDNPSGWDMGNASTSLYEVTCEGCLSGLGSRRRQPNPPVSGGARQRP